eukprot:345844-Hanusia_phi.AAC.1
MDAVFELSNHPLPETDPYDTPMDQWAPRKMNLSTCIDTIGERIYTNFSMCHIPFFLALSCRPGPNPRLPPPVTVTCRFSLSVPPRHYLSHSYGYSSAPDQVGIRCHGDCRPGLPGSAALSPAGPGPGGTGRGGSAGPRAVLRRPLNPKPTLASRIRRHCGPQ